MIKALLILLVVFCSTLTFPQVSAFDHGYTIAASLDHGFAQIQAQSDDEPVLPVLLSPFTTLEVPAVTVPRNSGPSLSVVASHLIRAPPTLA